MRPCLSFPPLLRHPSPGVLGYCIDEAPPSLGKRRGLIRSCLSSQKERLASFAVEGKAYELWEPTTRYHNLGLALAQLREGNRLRSVSVP